MASKRCSKCRVEKPLEAFYPNKSCKDGHVGQCKACLRATQRSRISDRKARGYREVVEKQCTYCGQTKAIDVFNSDKAAIDGHSYGCRVCNRRRRQDAYFRKEYGMDPGDYARMLEQQGGKCLICGTIDPGSKGRFHVDHDHGTGRVRGLLCERCNIGIGYFHAPEHLAQAALYLRSFSAANEHLGG